MRDSDRASILDPGEAAPAASQSERGLTRGIRPRGLLEAVSLGYLFLPWLIFIGGYLRFWIALPVLTITAWSLVAVYRHLREPGETEEESSNRSGTRRTVHAILVALVLMIVVFYSGAGGFAPQVTDYVKHNALLKDLVDYPWPVAYGETSMDGVGGPLTYYVFYYLPAAVVGKAFGWQAASGFSFLWTLIGVAAVTAWFLRIVGRVSVYFVLLLLFFGGLDLFGWIILNGWPNPAEDPLNRFIGEAVRGDESLKSLRLSYVSHLNSLVWVPQHALAAWLVVSILMYCALRGKGAQGLFFVASAMPLWSAFGAIGVFPFALLAALQASRNSHGQPIILRFKQIFSFPNAVAGPLLVLVAFLYLRSNRGGYPQGFLWQQYGFFEIAPLLILFYLVEFGIYVFLMPPPVRPEWNKVRPWLWTALVMLLVIPMYELSRFNDFVMRVSIPPLFVLAACLGWRLSRAAPGVATFRRAVLVILLVVGAASSVQLLAWEVTGNVKNPASPNPGLFLHMTEIGRRPVHFFGDPDAFFYRRMARPFERQPPRYETVVESWNFAQPTDRDVWSFPEATSFSELGAVIPLRYAGQEIRTRLPAPLQTPHVTGLRIFFTVRSTLDREIVHARTMKFRFVSADAEPIDAQSENGLEWRMGPLFQLVADRDRAMALAKLFPADGGGSSYDAIGVRFSPIREQRSRERSDPQRDLIVYRIELVR